MKLRSTLYLIPVCLIAVTAYFQNEQNNEPSYEPRTSSEDVAQSAAGQFEYRKMMNADPETGEINKEHVLELRNAMDRLKPTANRDAEDLVWTELGPDNIAGRVRAIESDPANPSVLYAGGVSGGLFKTEDLGNTWEFVDGLNSNLVISAISILGNGNIYVGTGNSNEGISGSGGSGFLGNGLFKSTDGGETFEVVSDFEPSTLSSGDDWSFVNRLIRDPNDPNAVWIAFGGGFRKYIDGNDDLEPRADGLPSGSAVSTDADISTDGSVISCVIADNVFISTDGGQNFEDRSGNGLPLPSTVNRAEFAMCPDDPSRMYAFMSNGSGYLHSCWASDDFGQTFDQIAFSSNNGTSDFSPCISANGQCWYDQDITVVPGDCDKVIIGGVRLYRWEKAVADPIFGQWEQIAFQNGQQPGNYIHADIHYFHWTSDNVLFVGCDGGVYRSEDNGNSIYPTNRYLNVTQLYDMDFGPKGQVIGGTQDNGSLYIDFLGNTLQEARSVGGGDGFDVEHSQFNEKVLFTSIYNGFVARSNDGGVNSSGFGPYETGPFYTVQEFWETDNDPNNTSEVSYVNFTTDTIFAGDTIPYLSQSLGLSLEYETPETVFPGDTVFLPDNVSTWYATSSSGTNPLSISRKAANFNTTNFEWMTPITSITGTITKMRFSADGNHLYVGTSGGRVDRISGLAEVYSPEEASIAFRPANNDSIISMTTNDTIVGGLNNVDFSADSYMFFDGTPVTYKVNVTTIRGAGGNGITGIAVDPNDPERVALSTGGYSTSSSHVLLSESAQSTQDNDTFDGVWSAPSGINGISRMPVYSVTFDKLNPGRIIAGTEFGIFVSENDGGSWQECNFDPSTGKQTIGRTPVYELLQQTYTFADQAVWNENTIYAGTHGRGFWFAGGDFTVDVEDITNLEDSKLIDGLNVYPNPLTETGTIAFNLNEMNDVEFSIYDMSGNLISSQGIMNMSAGQRNIQFDASGLANGIYIANIRVKDQVQFGKFIKM
ncbi:MAG: T9SS type A sorting domain-containing protein [Flavobacteriales bacterium]|nr:T9SS type A sorting domain-containing protein [Flavobacteriales bacterium]